MTAIDPVTKVEFEPKRSNQRFESKMTRIKYNNEKAKKVRHSLSYINKPLFNNYKVLSDLMGNKTEEQFNKHFLHGRGLHYGVFTHYMKYDGVSHKAIYDFIVVPIENDLIKVIKTKKND